MIHHTFKVPSTYSTFLILWWALTLHAEVLARSAEGKSIYNSSVKQSSRMFQHVLPH